MPESSSEDEDLIDSSPDSPKIRQPESAFGELGVLQAPTATEAEDPLFLESGSHFSQGVNGTEKEATEFHLILNEPAPNSIEGNLLLLICYRYQSKIDYDDQREY